MSFLPITVPATFYLAESRANLTQVGTFLNGLHESFFSYRRPSGGSNEYYEAFLTMGRQTIGVRYVSPREGYDKVDRFVVTANDGEGERESRVSIDLDFETGESKEDATKRWIDVTRAALVTASQLARLPLL